MTVFAGNERVVPPEVRGARHLARAGGGFAWVDLHEPSAAEVAEVATEFELDELIEQEVLQSHRRPGFEARDDTVFLSLRPARSVVEGIEPTTLDVLAVVGRDYAVTARWGGKPASPTPGGTWRECQTF